MPFNPSFFFDIEERERMTNQKEIMNDQSERENEELKRKKKREGFKGNRRFPLLEEESGRVFNSQLA